MKKVVDIVLPCYNPGNTWYLGLSDFYNLAKDKYVLNFILVNDGSVPGKIIEQLAWLEDRAIQVNYISYEKNMGKGHALRQGVEVSRSEFVVYTDVDFPFTNESTIRLIDVLVDNGYDVVAGYRDQNYYLKNMSAYRKMLSRTFRFFIKNILKMSVTDTQCGLKGFSKKGREKFLQTSINRYLFDFEFIYASERDAAIKLKTVQVQLKEGIVFSKMRPRILFQELFNLLYVLVLKRK